MNLRGPEMEGTKNINLRRSVRSKTTRVVDNSLTTIHSQRKRRYSKKSQKKTVESQPYFPPVEESGISEVIEELATLPAEDSHFLNEASVIHECRACQEFFRSLGGYLRHKQRICTSLVRPEAHTGNGNPFEKDEVCSLYGESSEEMTDGEHDEVHPALASAEVPRSGPPRAEISGQGRSPLLLPKAEASSSSEDFFYGFEVKSAETSHKNRTPFCESKTKAENFTNKVESSCEKDSVLLVPVAARTLETINCKLINIPSENIKTQINCFEQNSEMEERNTNLPTSMRESNLPENSCVESPHIELLESSSSHYPRYSVFGNTVDIKVETESFSDDVFQCTASSNNNKKINPKIPLWESKNFSSERHLTCTADGKSVNIKKEEDSFSDNELQYIGTSSGTNRTDPKTPCQEHKNTSSKKYPQFSIFGDVINMKIERDSFSNNNGDYASRLQVKRTSSRVGLRESKAKRQEAQQSSQRTLKFVCELCNATFKKGSDFRYHKRDQHFNFVLGYKCPFCTVYLLQIVKLSIHVTQSHNTMRDTLGNFLIQHKMLDIKDPRICRI